MKCDRCTLCCKFLKIEETDSNPNDYCKYCQPGIECKIYNERPESCQIFECTWKQMKHAGKELRPDRCNVLFEKWSDCVIIGMTDTKLSDLILKQIDYFRSEGISVLMLDHNEKLRTFFLASNHTKEFIRKEINGSTKLY